MKLSRIAVISTLTVALLTGFTYADTYKKIEVTADKLNVRADMTLESSILGKIEKGSIITSLGSENGWCTIEYNGQASFVSEEFTKVVEDSVEGKINAGKVNFRLAPSIADGEVIRIMNLEKIKVFNKENDWCLVEDEQGNRGYVFADYVTVGDIVSEKVVSRGESRSDLVAIAKSRLGKPYKWGAAGPNSFDCSGFIMYSYKEAYGKNLGHSSKAMSKMGTSINKADLIPGDLVFFSTDRSGNVNHVGIYLGNGEFIHASSSKYNGKQVAVSNLNTGFYNEVYKWGKRIDID